VATINIYWQDLTEKCQNEIREMLNLEEDDDNNWTYIPMATIDIEDER
jgi:hypothetical protein